jgi:signal transduction histidine kinase
MYTLEMLHRNLLLNNLLRLEVVKKGQPATFAFLGFALFSFFYGYGCQEYLFYIKTASVFLVAISLLRFFLYKNILNKGSLTQKEWIFTVTLITSNAVGLGIILGLASFELKLSGPHFIVVTTLLAGLIGASIVSLSFFAILFVPFQSVLLLPQIGIILYYYFSPEHLNFLPLIILYLMYYFYQLRQFRSYKKDLIQLFTYQIELERKNQELIDNKNIIMDQTVKLIHTSRLAVLGEMSTGIAHEINNPLTIISASVQVLSRLGTNDKLDVGQVIKYSQKIYRSVERISKIVKGLKHFATQSDRIPKESVYIQDILDETTQFCSEHLEGLGITLKVEEVPPLQIHCRSIQISQVLINLLKNASDALAKETQEQEKWIAINFKQDTEFFYVHISNGGEKIPQVIAEKIFHPFFTTKEREKGTGLGLSISHTIMKDHGGDLYYDLSNDFFTTFVIKHPVEYN